MTIGYSYSYYAPILYSRVSISDPEPVYLIDSGPPAKVSSAVVEFKLKRPFHSGGSTSKEAATTS